MPRALITGITGQDGQHLAEFLHSKGYEVFGLVKGQNNPKAELVSQEFPYVELVPGDLADLPSLVAALEFTQPDEVYNLGAISFVALWFNQAELTANITGLGVLRMLEAIRMVGGAENNPIRFYQASSSEMFGKVRETPQNEKTPFHPRSPYGCAKVFGHDIMVNYRESYGLFACSGILFNHEGPRAARVRHPQDHQRRGPHQARLAGRPRARQPRVQARLGLCRRLREGDVAHAAAGRARRLRRRHGPDPQVREFVEAAFAEVGLDDWQKYVRQDPALLPSGRGRSAHRRRDEGAREARLAPGGRLPGLVQRMLAHDLAVETRKAERR